MGRIIARPLLRTAYYAVMLPLLPVIAPRWRPLLLLLAGTLLALAMVGAVAARGIAPSLGAVLDSTTDGHRFSLARFEREHLFARPLGLLGDFLTGRDTTGPDADALLDRYFALTATLATLPADDPARADLADDRAALENRAERILEARTAGALRAAGLSRPLPLFGGQSLLWPPLDAELSVPPRVLAVSPRDEIRLLRTVLLDPALPPDAVTAIEAALEADGRFSALVDRIGGVAAYPAIVRNSRSYAATVEVMAHEWTHHYLYFYPLGAAFWDSPDLRTVNETVANMVGREIAAAVLAAHPSVQPDAPAPATAETAAADALLRQIRRDVDALLAQGKVAAAEARMEEGRQQLAALGRPLRRLNQAFFAFNGVYADTPASSSPLGPALQALRDASPTLADFIAAVREIDDPALLLHPGG